MPTHNQYRIEVFIQEAVQFGNEDNLRYAFILPQHGKPGVLGPTTARSLRNHTHLINVLCSRAAIRGGVPPEAAYTLSDRLFMAVENMPDEEVSFDTRLPVALAFLRQVQNYRQQQLGKQFNPRVEQAKNYIKRHLFDEITPAHIAAHCGISADYLHKIFKQSKEDSVSAYVQNERLKAAAELLTDSKLKIAEIATLLNFSSSSHFCRAFKQYFALSPLGYRKPHLKHADC